MEGMIIVVCFVFFVVLESKTSTFFNISLAFLFSPFIHLPLPSICRLAISQMITSAGVLCAFRHLSNDDNDGRDRNTMRQKDSMNGFPENETMIQRS